MSLQRNDEREHPPPASTPPPPERPPGLFIPRRILLATTITLAGLTTAATAVAYPTIAVPIGVGAAVTGLLLTLLKSR
jgi:hypothetical protein